MAVVIPTSKWVLALLVIPGLGSVQRPPVGAAPKVSSAQLNWLLNQGYVASTDAEGSHAKRSAAIAPVVTEPETPPASEQVGQDAEEQADAPTSEEEAIGPEVVEPTQSGEPPVEHGGLEGWMVAALEFLSVNDAVAIDEKVKGIGVKTSARIVKLQQSETALTWQQLDEVLTANQMNAVEAAFNI